MLKLLAITYQGLDQTPPSKKKKKLLSDLGSDLKIISNQRNLNIILFIYPQIADEMKPHPLVISVLTKLCNFIPTWKIIPSKDVIDAAFRRPEIREQVF